MTGALSVSNLFQSAVQHSRKIDIAFERLVNWGCERAVVRGYATYRRIMCFSPLEGVDSHDLLRV